MNTSEQAVSMIRRRRHSPEFKAEAIGACLQPGVSIAAVALSRGLNANLLRRWLVEAERTGTLPVSSTQGPLESSGHFVPVTLSPTLAEPTIRIELRSGSGTVNVQWPVSAASECVSLLRELTR
ncbi:MAG: transposase [Mucilaginibacter sp.]|nr:transposase [Mucilaginibacter sp.]